MKYLPLIAVFVIVVVLVGVTSLFHTNAKGPIVQSIQATGQRDETFRVLIDMAERTGSVHVIVGLTTRFVPEGNLSQPERTRQRTDIKKVQDNFEGRYRMSLLSPIKTFDYIPYVALETDAAGLKQMQSDNSVATIEEDRVSNGGLTESIPIVGAQTAWNSGYTGMGETVAILDTGVDKNHTFLAGKVISEGCYSSNNSSSTSFCPGGATESTAADSGLNCPVSVSGCDHGTHVAGIAAGKGAAFSGVAKDANIIAIKIFSQFGAASCNPSPCARYWTSDLIRGLERVNTLSATMNNIAAVNLSLQTGEQFTSSCDIAHSATKAAIDNLRSVGIPTIVCAGNFSFTTALTAPACISTAVSVGSTDDGSLGTSADVVSNFSDSSPLLHLLAPGRWINSSVPGNGFANFSGTSMATPHVVGAFAILKQRNHNASIQRILNALIVSGQPITDSRNGLVKPRIRIGNAVNIVAQKAAADFDGDGKTDLSAFRPSDGNWYVFQSGGSGALVRNWGVPGDVLTPGDYDGDGKADTAAFRPSTGQWLIFRSSDSTVNILNFGIAGDRPVPGDYDGDGKMDVAQFRSSEGTWYVFRSSDNGVSITNWGVATDAAVQADYDGDGKTDVAVFRPSTGVWYAFRSTAGVMVVGWGLAGDKPVEADYDGDGKDDVAVYRPSEGNWYVFRSSDNSVQIVNWGNATDVPSPGDYDGDGKADFAVFRDGTWFAFESTAGPVVSTWGAAGDISIPAKYIP